MNRLCYRIVFNRLRGMLMAVAECACARSRSSGQGRRPVPQQPPPPASVAARLRPTVLRCWLAFGLVLPALPAPAQIVAYKNPPAGQTPTVLAAPNGVPLVNIRTPNAAGLSHNAYSRFDVPPQGTLLNNSPDAVQTQLGGWVQGNPWLATGSARIILNEVFSNDPSLLRGYIEVAGQQAQVVVANPSGVTCTGCGFIHAHRVTLTTGTPRVAADGRLDAYRVTGGTVLIDGNGLDTSSSDFTEIIARAVRVNAGLWARQLHVAAGTSLVDAATLDTTALASPTPAPTLAIDVASLGGMYARKITLVGTEAGVGVRSAGTLGASIGEFVISAAGHLENTGTLTSADALRVTTTGLRNSGTFYAQGEARVSTTGVLENDGLIASAAHTAIAAARFIGTSGGVIASGLASDGNLGATGDLHLDITQGLTGPGQILSGGDQTLRAAQIDLSGAQLRSICAARRVWSPQIGRAHV